MLESGEGGSDQDPLGGAGLSVVGEKNMAGWCISSKSRAVESNERFDMMMT